MTFVLPPAVGGALRGPPVRSSPGPLMPPTGGGVGVRELPRELPRELVRDAPATGGGDAHCETLEPAALATVPPGARVAAVSVGPKGHGTADGSEGRRTDLDLAAAAPPPDGKSKAASEARSLRSSCDVSCFIESLSVVSAAAEALVQSLCVLVM